MTDYTKRQAGIYRLIKIDDRRYQAQQMNNDREWIGYDVIVFSGPHPRDGQQIDPLEETFQLPENEFEAFCKRSCRIMRPVMAE